MTLALSRESTTIQLIAASELLIDESITTIINLNLSELDNKQINKLAKLTLKQIDDSTDMIDALKPVPDIDIQRAIVKLEQTIDSCFISLNQHYTELQNRILTSDVVADDLINYAEFCHQLSMKLLKKASKTSSCSQLQSLPLQSQTLLTDKEIERFL